MVCWFDKLPLAILLLEEGLDGFGALVGGLLSETKIKIKFKICTLGLIWVYMDLLQRCHQGVTSTFTPELPLRVK